MNLYLLDENVIREMRPGGHPNVKAWLASVGDDQLRLSAMTTFEKRLGWERERRKAADKGADTAAIDAKLAALSSFEGSFAGRIIPIDNEVAAEWAKLLGAKEKNQRDACLAATCRVHGLVLATRNTKDFVGRDISVLDPFKSPAKIEEI